LATTLTTRLKFQPLSGADIPELENVLRNEDVYRFIGGKPSSSDFWLGTERAISGPTEDRTSEVWLNFSARLQGTDQLVGQLQATIHHGVAEVAFLFAPSVWGHGYATEGLLWLHAQLASRPQPPKLWATTVQANVRTQTLLRRCGYVEVAPKDAPHLLTYDEGDLVFNIQNAA
jgi:RimJ/RimL family protein N-acetyltransferase